MDDKLNLHIADVRAKVFVRDNYQCQYPGCKFMGSMHLQIAHRISKTKGNRKYIKKKFNLQTEKDIDNVIHHELNLVSSCSKHNSYFNIGNKPVERDELLDKIMGDYTGGVYENIKSICGYWRK